MSKILRPCSKLKVTVDDKLYLLYDGITEEESVEKLTYRVTLYGSLKYKRKKIFQITDRQYLFYISIIYTFKKV